jgi:cyclopropane fatty-acyl-phospholipid synthase-like methyltransferase
MTSDVTPDASLTAAAGSQESRAGWLSRYAREKKLEFFFAQIPKDAAILDVGCADGWVRRWAESRGWTNIVGIDLVGPADIVGDVNEWPALGLQAQSFDAIVAFEVVEHGDMAEALRALLKPTGRLYATTPVPSMDWACKALERIGFLQERTSEHSHLVDLRTYPGFRPVDRRVKGLMSQWGVLAPRQE